MNKKFYQKEWFALIMCFIFFPIGIYLFLKNTKYGKVEKIAIIPSSIVMNIIGIIMISAVLGSQPQTTPKKIPTENQVDLNDKKEDKEAKKRAEEKKKQDEIILKEKKEKEEQEKLAKQEEQRQQEIQRKQEAEQQEIARQQEITRQQEEQRQQEVQQQEAQRQAQAQTQTTQGLIKGSVNNIYHVPGGAYYERTKNVVQWFNTEAEAQAAGYRRSQR